MPYEGLGLRQVAAAPIELTHGQPVVVDGFPGVAFKSAQVGSFIDPADAATIAVDEEFVIQMGGVHEIDASLFSNITPAVGDEIYIDPSDMDLYESSQLSGTNEVQTVTVDATGGTFTVTYDGETTSALAFNVSASNFQAALLALSNIPAGSVTVTGGPGASGGGTPYTITFVGELAGTNVPAVTTGVASLTGGAGTAAVATSTPGVAGDELVKFGRVCSVSGDVVRINANARDTF